MAIGKSSDFKIYDDQFWGGYVEMIEQNANAFNSASNGAIVLVPERLIGSYSKESFITTVANLVTRRDLTAVTAATDLGLAQNENVSVKIHRKLGPIAQTLDAFRKIMGDVNSETLSLMLGEQIGKAVVTDYLNTAVMGANAAISGVAALNYDYSATGTLNHGALNQGLAKFGDAAGQLKCWVMHSKPFFDLIAAAMTDKLWDVGSVAVYGGAPPTFGRPVVVADVPALFNATPTPDQYHTLCLVEGAATVTESEQRDIVSQIITGLEQLVVRVQGEYAYNLGIKGYTWDVTNGGANPADAAVATATNWDKVSTDNKSTAGIRIVTQ